MTIKDAFPVPPLYINKYLWDSFKSLDPSLATDYGNIVPFFPLSDTRADEWPWQTKPYVIYDQLIKMRGRPNYFVKRNQLLYVVKGVPTEVLAWTNAIGMILDRQDAAGQDINKWLADNDPTAGIYFHWFKVMQIDASYENRMDLSVNQKYLSTMIVEYEFHPTRVHQFD